MRVKPVTPAEIRGLRELLERSVPEFAELMNVTPITVYKWEAGTRNPSGAALLALRAGIDRARVWNDAQAEKARKKLGKLAVGAGAVAAFLYLISGKES